MGTEVWSVGRQHYGWSGMSSALVLSHADRRAWATAAVSSAADTTAEHSFGPLPWQRTTTTPQTAEHDVVTSTETLQGLPSLH